MQENKPNPGLVFQTMHAVQKSSALLAAIKLDLFSGLDEKEWRGVSELSEYCNGSERGTRILCDFLTISGLIEKEGDRYRHTPTSAVFLDSSSPHCVASTVLFMNNPEISVPYERLDEIVRTGSTTLPGQGTVEPDHPVWVDFARKMAPMMAPMTKPLGEVVLREKKGPVKVLDIAAGHGLFGIEVARQNPEAEIIALDWARVLEVAEENAEKLGVGSRYQLKPGSAFEVDFEGPYDIILLTNFLHHFDAATCTELLRKCHGALVSDGIVAALEFVPNPDRVTPPDAASFALVMLATTASGDAYTYPEYKKMYLDAGFEETALHEIPESPHRIVVGRKA